MSFPIVEKNWPSGCRQADFFERFWKSLFWKILFNKIFEILNFFFFNTCTPRRLIIGEKIIQLSCTNHALWHDSWFLRFPILLEKNRKISRHAHVYGPNPKFFWATNLPMCGLSKNKIKIFGPADEDLHYNWLLVLCSWFLVLEISLEISIQSFDQSAVLETSLTSCRKISSCADVVSKL